ncbi:hypothetical protein ACHAPA_005525 [Fusarium lateritium]
MSKRERESAFPGFKALSNQVFVRRGEELETTKPTAGHPHTVIVYGWGDAPSKHVSKFTDGYQKLYPHARQIAVLSPIYQGFFDSLAQRTRKMLPVINEVFPKDSQGAAPGPILIHCLSNTGIGSYHSTLNAYKELYNKPLPHNLTVYDSTPGTSNLTWPNVKRWSNAMAIGPAAKLPWPFFVTQGFCILFFLFIHLFDFLAGRESSPWFSHRVFYDERWESKDCSRLFLYGKKDILIPWEHIEGHIAESRRIGYVVDSQLFDDSGHVGHMRKHPEMYWEAIRSSWEKAVKAS